MWIVIFFIGLLYVLFKATKEPVWAAMGAAYVYYALPPREFGAPDVPWQAALWAIATVMSATYGAKAVEWAKQDLLAASRGAYERGLEKANEAFRNAIYQTALQGGGRGVADAGIAAGSPAINIAARTGPEILEPLIAPAVEAAIAAGARVGEKECVKALESGRGADPKSLAASMKRRVDPFIDEAMEKAYSSTIEASITAYMEKAEEGGEPPYPKTRSPWKAVFTNSGMILFTLWGVFCLLQTFLLDLPRPGAAASKLAVIKLLYIPMIAIVASIRTDKHLRYFTFAWMFGVWHLSFAAAKKWVTFGGRIDDVGGQGGEANFLGAIIILVAPIAFSMFVSESTKMGKRIGLFAGGSYVLGILACGSRGAMLALMGQMAYWLTQTTKKGRAGALAMVGVACFLAVAPPSFIKRMQTIIEPKGTGFSKPKVEESKRERQELWKLAVELWKEHPVMGVGINQYPAHSAIRLPELKGAYSGQPGLMTHNSWLQNLSEFGTIGFLFWAGAFFGSGWMWRKARIKMKPYEGYAWFGGICLGFEAGTLGTGLGITFSSFQWLDYLYWHMLMGPLAYQIACDTAARLDFVKPRELEESQMAGAARQGMGQTQPGGGMRPAVPGAGGPPPPRPSQPGFPGQRPSGPPGARPAGRPPGFGGPGAAPGQPSRPGPTQPGRGGPPGPGGRPPGGGGWRPA